MPLPYLVRDIITDDSKLVVKADPGFAGLYMNGDFHVAYSRDIRLKFLDDEILLAPFLLNIAPLVWLSGEKFRLESMDADLFSTFEEVHKTYRWMYPRHRWDGEIIPDRLTTARERGIGDPSLDTAYVFFSGGVDSLYTSLNNEHSPQCLIAVWGGDIPLGHEKKWRQTRQLCEDHARRHGHSTLYAQGNIQDVIRRKSIYPDIHIWWSNIQFGMGLVGLAIPPLIADGAASILIASESMGDVGKPWGSSLYLEGQVRFAGRSVIHHGLEANRQQKVAYIVGYYRSSGKEPEPIRVCMRPYAEDANCCDCEKCLRTIIALMLEGENPSCYGFAIKPEDACHKVKKKVDDLRLKMSESRMAVWKELQQRAQAVVNTHTARKDETSQDFFPWLAGMDFEKYHYEYKRKHALQTWLKLQIGRFPRAFDLARGLVEHLGWHS